MITFIICKINVASYLCCFFFPPHCSSITFCFHKSLYLAYSNCNYFYNWKYSNCNELLQLKMTYICRNMSCKLKTVVLFPQIITNFLLSHLFGDTNKSNIHWTSHFGINMIIIISNAIFIQENLSVLKNNCCQQGPVIISEIAKKEKRKSKKEKWNNTKKSKI